MSEEPQAELTRPGAGRLIRVAIIGTVAGVLWILAIGAVVLDEFVPLHAPLVDLVLMLALSLSLVATTVGMDCRRQRRHDELVNRLGRLSDDTVTNLAEVMAQMQEVVAVEKRLVGEMRQIAAEALATALNPQALAEVVDLGQRVAAGPARPMNGTHRPAT